MSAHEVLAIAAIALGVTALISIAVAANQPAFWRD